MLWLVAFALVGGFVASHLPRNPIGWVLSGVPAALTAIFLGEAVYFHAARVHGHAPGVGAEFGLWVANSMWIPAVLLVLVALPLLFPTGRPPTPRWRIVGWAAVAGGVLLFAGIAFLPGPLENYDWVDNPLAVAWMPGFVDWVGFALWCGDDDRRRRLDRRALPPLARDRARAAQVVHHRRGAAVLGFVLSFSLSS